MREIVNAKITSTFLGIEDHGIFTCVLYCMSGSTGQGFGTHNLAFEDYGIAYLRGILEALKVDSWEKLPGMYARIDRDYMSVYRIGHIVEDSWFCPQDLVKVKP